MAILHDRVTSLERRAKKTDKNIKGLRRDLDGLDAFVEDEAALRAINDEQIRLLKKADAIHARRLGRIARQLRRPPRSR